MEYKLIDAVPEDAAWVDSLTEKTMETYIRAAWKTEEEYQHYLCLNRFVLEATQIIIVDGKKAGRLSCRREDGSFHLDELHIEENFQGLGLGSRILGDMIELARSEGLPLELKCLRTNPVHNLYIRLGFSLIKEDEKRLYYRIK